MTPPRPSGTHSTDQPATTNGAPAPHIDLTATWKGSPFVALGAAYGTGSFNGEPMVAVLITPFADPCPQVGLPSTADMLQVGFTTTSRQPIDTGTYPVYEPNGVPSTADRVGVLTFLTHSGSIYEYYTAGSVSLDTLAGDTLAMTIVGAKTAAGDSLDGSAVVKLCPALSAMINNTR